MEINDKQLGKTFYVFDADVLSGSLSTFEKTIPWDDLHLRGNDNTVAVYYISGEGQVGVKEIEIFLDTRIDESKNFTSAARRPSVLTH